MMLSRRWQPFAWNQLERLQDEVKDLVNRFGFEREWPSFGGAFPPVNLWEDAGNLYVEAELPGMKLDNLEIYVQGGQLTLKGDRQTVTPEGGVWHRQERGAGAFSRSIELPVDVNADKVEARFEHGVLHVTLPKSEAVKPRKIVVKAE